MLFKKNEDVKPDIYDVIILGGGAAGLMCALTAGQRKKRVLVIEVSNKLGKKILMSGGGRCNFTNMDVAADNFICPNPHFVKSALNQYTQWDFIGLVGKYDVAYHEREHGQLFCDQSAKDILKILTTECDEVGVEVNLNCDVSAVATLVDQKGFCLTSNQGNFTCRKLVVATGGLSIPTLGGATGYGYELARHFELDVSQTEASLVPFTLTGKLHELAHSISGVSVPVVASVPGKSFKESLLFTHRGLSGPVILQLSNYWYLGNEISIDFLPNQSFDETLVEQKSLGKKLTISSLLSQSLPKSLVQELGRIGWSNLASTPLPEIKNAELLRIGKLINEWRLLPSGTEGYRTAEVTRGGVVVDQVSSKTMEVKSIPNLFLIGEVLDVTAHLGGYNFQWAWSSGYVAGLNV